ncbi:OLC1v1022723C1 [Oldenlandia corymbosa var. corymbosa]|uniref:OLC1v1022723C1 n=1 Tax=Oldenlandia corymbosa var. corymbosa TaxID=529605 RepID=A0AAV1C264_OLDCO|nr:OLC1v1022723C1 [Oldenlandia corymbosa var. corymbosa]
MVESKSGDPWLVYLHGRHQTFCKISSPGVISKSIPQFRYTTILYSSPDGKWLVLVEDDNRAVYRFFPREKRIKERFFLWSPSTGESITLPTPRPSRQRCIITQALLLMSSDSTTGTTSPDLVLLFVSDMPLVLYCHVDYDWEWSEFNYARCIESQTRPTPLPQGYSLCSPVSFNGKIYATATSCPSDLVRIDIDGNSNCEMHLLMPEEDRSAHLQNRSSGFTSSSLSGYSTSYLVALGGDQDLCLISMLPCSFSRYQESLSISISTFNFSINSWEPRTGLNGGAVFLCDSYSLCSSPPGDNNEWSYIYFTFDQTMLCYRVEDERVTSHSLCPPMLQEGSWVSKRWILPNDAYIHGLHREVLISGMVDNSGYQKRKIVAKRTSKKRLRISKMENDAECVPYSSLLCDLSSEVLGLIANKLSFVDYINFRCVNKLCASMTVRSKTNPFPPCLIYKDRFNGVYNLVDSNLKHKLSVKVPEALREYKIRCCRDGWLLLEYKLLDYAFFNPFTMQVIPAGCKPDTKDGFINFTFLSKPSSPDCSILAMSRGRVWGRSRFVKHLPELGGGETKWWTFVVGKGGADEPPFLSHGCNSPVVSRNACYYLGDSGRLGLGRFIEEEKSLFRWEVLEDIEFPVKDFGCSYLTECGGRLVSILVGDKHGKRSWVRVFKLKEDDIERCWEEIDSLDGYCLYLSYSSSMSRLAETPDVANRIYFPKFCKDELVYYSLNSKRYHSMGSQHELQNSHKITMYWDCAWITPHRS